MNGKIINPYFELKILDEDIILLPDRGLFWLSKKILIISDLHLGKDHTFRHYGISIPQGTTQDDLTRLSALLEHTNAQELWILGDMVHASLTHSPNTLPWLNEWKTFREKHKELHISLVRGNHDAYLLKELLLLDDEIDEGKYLAPFYLCHDPIKPSQADAPFTIAGHIHPVVKLPPMARRWPSFAITKDQLILPAFSFFTGGELIHPKEDNHLFLCVQKEIIPLRINPEPPYPQNPL